MKVRLLTLALAALVVLTGMSLRHSLAAISASHDSSSLMAVGGSPAPIPPDGTAVGGSPAPIPPDDPAVGGSPAPIPPDGSARVGKR